MAKFTYKRSRCDCHPETCSCNDYVILMDGEKLVTVFNEDAAVKFIKKMEKENV